MSRYILLRVEDSEERSSTDAGGDLIHGLHILASGKVNGVADDQADSIGGTFVKRAAPHVTLVASGIWDT